MKVRFHTTISPATVELAKKALDEAAEDVAKSFMTWVVDGKAANASSGSPGTRATTKIKDGALRHATSVFVGKKKVDDYEEPELTPMGRSKFGNEAERATVNEDSGPSGPDITTITLVQNTDYAKYQHELPALGHKSVRHRAEHKWLEKHIYGDAEALLSLWYDKFEMEMRKALPLQQLEGKAVK